MNEARTPTEAEARPRVAEEAGEAGRLLIVDDDPRFLRRLGRAMERRGFAVAAAAGVEEGRAAIASMPPDYAVVDLRLEDGSGLEVVQALREARPEARIVVLTGYGNIATAVAAVKAEGTVRTVAPARLSRR